MKLVLFIAIAFSTLVYLTLSFRLTGIGHWSWVVASVPFSMVLSYIMVLRDRLPPQLDRVFRKLAYYNMGLVSFIFGLIVFRDVVYLVFRIVLPDFPYNLLSRESTLGLLATSAIFFAYGYWNAVRGPRVVSVAIPIDDLPQELDGYSILQLSDLHVGPAVNASYVQKVVNMTLDFKADVIVMTGDMVDGDYHRYKSFVETFASLIKALPVLYVAGNHEYYKDGELWLEHLRQMGIKTLLNQNISMPFKGKTVLFAGITDPAAKMVDARMGPNISASLENAAPSDLKILLAHQPKIAPEATDLFHLQLSGHTHGGQFFPWNFVIRLVQKFPKGLMKCGKMWVYVNVGTGFWGPRLRLGTRSEITHIRIIKGKSQSK